MQIIATLVIIALCGGLLLYFKRTEIKKKSVDSDEERAKAAAKTAQDFMNVIDIGENCLYLKDNMAILFADYFRKHKGKPIVVSMQKEKSQQLEMMCDLYEGTENNGIYTVNGIDLYYMKNGRYYAPSQLDIAPDIYATDGSTDLVDIINYLNISNLDCFYSSVWWWNNQDDYDTMVKESIADTKPVVLYAAISSNIAGRSSVSDKNKWLK